MKAPFQSKGDLYAGKIVKDNGDGTYEVLFDDGDVDGAVRLIRAVEEDQASAKKSDEATPPEASNLTQLMRILLRQLLLRTRTKRASF